MGGVEVATSRQTKGMERERKEQREERRGKELAQGKHEKSAAVL